VIRTDASAPNLWVPCFPSHRIRRTGATEEAATVANGVYEELGRLAHRRGNAGSMQLTT